METEEIVVLANSTKMGGRCVAGISTRSGSWVRPVSGRPEGELRPTDCAVRGRAPRCLDLVRFPYVERVADPAQPENVLIEGGGWELVDRMDPAAAYGYLQGHLEPGPAVLGGLGKGVPDDVAQEGLEASICLVEPDSIQFESAPPYQPGRARKARAVFELKGHWWDLGISDGIVAPRLRAADIGSYALDEIGFKSPGRTLLTVSLTMPLNETRWKLAAAVLLLP